MFWEHENKCLKGAPRERSGASLPNQCPVNGTESFWGTRKTFRLCPRCSPKPPTLSSGALTERFQVLPERTVLFQFLLISYGQFAPEDEI